MFFIFHHTTYPIYFQKMNSPSNLPSTDDSITTPSPTKADGSITPMPSHKDISIEIENLYGHMDPPPPSALALKTIQIRKRLDKIWGKTDFDADLLNEPDFSNQGCTSNCRFSKNGWFGDKCLQLKWRDHTPISENTYGTQIIQGNKLMSISKRQTEMFDHYPRRSTSSPPPPIPVPVTTPPPNTPPPHTPPHQLLPPSIPPKPTMQSISELRGKRVSTSEMAHILVAYNEKFGINQIDFDDISYDNPSEKAHWDRLKVITNPNTISANKKQMEAWKATQKMLDKPSEIVLYDESSSEEDIDSTISVEHKLRMLYSSSDDSESIHPQSTTTLDLSKKSVPIPIVGFTND